MRDLGEKVVGADQWDRDVSEREEGDAGRTSAGLRARGRCWAAAGLARPVGPFHFFFELFSPFQKFWKFITFAKHIQMDSNQFV